MALTNRLMKRFWGDPTAEGYRRSLRGLQEGDRRQLAIGLALVAVAYLRSTAPRKELIYRKTVPKDSSLIIHHKRRGSPNLEVVKHKRR